MLTNSSLLQNFLHSGLLRRAARTNQLLVKILSASFFLSQAIEVGILFLVSQLDACAVKEDIVMFPGSAYIK